MKRRLKMKKTLKNSYLNQQSYQKLQELNESLTATLAITGILGLLITALIQAGVDYFFSRDKVNFKNKIRAIEAAFKRKRGSLPKEFEYIIKNYSPRSEYAKKGLYGIWSNMSISEDLFNPPSLFYTMKVKDDFDLENTDIIVAQAKGNTKSFFVLGRDNKIYLVTKVSRIKKYDSYNEMLEKYFQIKLKQKG
jgi:hypothetical protein